MPLLNISLLPLSILGTILNFLDILLITDSKIEHLFMSSFVICKFSSVKRLLLFFAHVLVELFIFFINSYSVLGSVLGGQNDYMNETNKSSHPLEIYILMKVRVVTRHIHVYQ